MEPAKRISHAHEKKKDDLRCKQTCISTIQGSSPDEIPEVCQCVMSAQGCFHRPGNNMPPPLCQPCGLSDESTPQCKYGWEKGRLSTWYERMQISPWDRQRGHYLLTKSPWGKAVVTNGPPLSFSGQARCLTRLTGLNSNQLIQSTYVHTLNHFSPMLFDRPSMKLIRKANKVNMWGNGKIKLWNCFRGPLWKYILKSDSMRKTFSSINKSWPVNDKRDAVFREMCRHIGFSFRYGMICGMSGMRSQLSVTDPE